MSKTTMWMTAALMLVGCSSSGGKNKDGQVRKDGVIKKDGARRDLPPTTFDGGACSVKGIFYPDIDADGYGSSAAAPMEACPGPNLSPNNLDCNDNDPDAHPLQTQFFMKQGDFNCDGKIEKKYDYGFALCSARFSAAECNQTFATQMWNADHQPACGESAVVNTGCYWSKIAGSVPTTYGCLSIGTLKVIQMCR
jgi:hypothetical protein